MTDTVWKFYDFSVIQILREIIFGEYNSSKLKLPFLCNFGRFEFNQFGKLRPSKNVKLEKNQNLQTDFALLGSPKFISRKQIRETVKSFDPMLLRPNCVWKTKFITCKQSAEARKQTHFGFIKILQKMYTFRVISI